MKVVFPDQEYLFVSKNGTPFKKGNRGINSFAQQSKRDLTAIFGKEVTVNTLRHSYATHQVMRYKNDEITMKELEEGAMDMAHSLRQQLMYVRNIV
jgi:site-specific recombinase XerC